MSSGGGGVFVSGSGVEMTASEPEQAIAQQKKTAIENRKSELMSVPSAKESNSATDHSLLRHGSLGVSHDNLRCVQCVQNGVLHIGVSARCSEIGGGGSRA